jgi:hypothetical protein
VQSRSYCNFEMQWLTRDGKNKVFFNLLLDYVYSYHYSLRCVLFMVSSTDSLQ